MSRLLAVDPGIRGCGFSFFNDGRLVAAAYVKSIERRGNRAHEAVQMARSVLDVFKYTEAPNELAVEWPQVYASRIRAGVTKEDPNDLLALTAVDAAIAALLNVPVTSYFPAEWKGQLTKEACRQRIETRLSDDELRTADAAAREAKSLDHNMWDAIGIGLHHLGRFARRRVIAP